MTTSFTYDVNTGLPVVLDDGSRKYVWGIGLAYAVKTDGTLEVYQTDGLGSVRAITDSNGSITQTYRTDEFGIPTLTQGTSSQPFQYTGEQRDSESGLVYLRARMYDPAIGRFLQRDPLVGSLASPLSLNRFSYAQNNPVNLTDPGGLDPADTPAITADSYNPCFLQGINKTVVGGCGVWTLPRGRSHSWDDFLKALLAALGLSIASTGRPHIEEIQYVVRGGLSTPDRFTGGTGVKVDPVTGILSGISVQSAPGRSIAELASYLPHKTIGVTTLDRIRAIGGTVIPDPTPYNPYHALLSGITAEQAVALFTPTMPNPNPLKR